MKKKLLVVLAMGIFGFVMVGMANATPITVYNTGVDDVGSLIALRDADSHYSLLNPSSVTASAYAAGNGHNAWVNPLDSSGAGIAQWINPTGNGTSRVAPGNWDYSMTFELAADYSTASMGGRWASDNAAEIFLNGTITGNTTSYANFTDYTNFLINTGFQSGTNTLTFRVNNATNTSNPSGLLVEFEYADSETAPVPEPATMLLFGTGLAGLVGVRVRRKKKA